jgi:hypothetical protein
MSVVFASLMLWTPLMSGCLVPEEDSGSEGYATPNDHDEEGHEVEGHEDEDNEEAEVADEVNTLFPELIFDEKYFDGHLCNGKPTPVLPPGRWDWAAEDSDLATWKTFKNTIGEFELIKNAQSQPVRWNLLRSSPSGVDFAGSAAYFEGSSLADIVNLGAQGKLHSFSGSLREGPDVLVFNEAWSVDFSTSSAKAGLGNDNDLVVAGCDQNNDSSFDIKSASIHTGAGSDLLFVRDAKAAGFDAGNLDGVTSELDPQDGSDVVVYRGNMLDFRFFGGKGDDTAVWYVDEGHQDTPWLGPNFFGGGGAGDALWSDTGTDRLVLVIPKDTKMITSGATKPGELLVRVLSDYSDAIDWDDPTVKDPRAKYCITCGVGPKGRKTLTLEYRSKSDHIQTGYFWVTAFEELQIGLGAQALVYKLNDILGTATLDTSLAPFEPPSLDPKHCQGKS